MLTRPISSRKSSISSSSASNATGSRHFGWTGAIGVVITVLLLWWVLHDVEFAEVAGHLKNASPVLLVASTVATTLTFPLRAIRWRYLLRFEGTVLPFVPLWHATAIGFMANNILPVRAGEFARAYAARRLTGVRFTTAFASIAVERILDGITLVALLIVGVAAAGFEPGTTIQGMTIERIATVAGALFGGVLLVAVLVVSRPQAALALARRVFDTVLPAHWAERASRAFEGLVAGLDALRAPRRLAAAAFWSFVVWTVGALAFWLGLKAFQIDAPWSAALLMQSVIAFGVAVPSSPGFFGVFEAAARASLALYGVPTALSVSFAIGLHMAWFIPITLLGLYSLWRAGLHLRELRGDTPPPPAHPR